MKRTVTVKLQPSKKQAKILHQLADTGAKVWNRVNYLRRQQFFKEQIVVMKNSSGKSAQQQSSKYAAKTLKHGVHSSHSFTKSGMMNSPLGLSPNHQTT